MLQWELGVSFGKEVLESLVIYRHVADGLQPPPARLLLLEQLPPSAGICSVKLGKHVFPERLQRLACNNSAASRCLNYNLCFRVSYGSRYHYCRKEENGLTKHLSVDVFTKLRHPLPPKTIDEGLVHDTTDGIDGYFVDKKLKLYKVALAPSCVLVI